LVFSAGIIFWAMKAHSFWGKKCHAVLVSVILLLPQSGNGQLTITPLIIAFVLGFIAGNIGLASLLIIIKLSE